MRRRSRIAEVASFRFRGRIRGEGRSLTPDAAPPLKLLPEADES